MNASEKPEQPALDGIPATVQEPGYVRDTLLEIIGSEEYARSFQSIRQYRMALLKHIENRRVADAITRQAQACAAAERVMA